MSAMHTDDGCWIMTAPERALGEPLRGEQRADVAVVGGGVVGVSTALMLQRARRNVVLLEAGLIGRGATGKSTAKVTSQHGMIYHHLETQHNRRAASVYAQSNEAGKEWIAAQVRELSIDCEFENRAAYVYAEDHALASELERETEAAARAGLPARYLADGTEVPVEARAAMRFDSQAQFHPVKYLMRLADEFLARGGRIHERTRVIRVRGRSPCEVETRTGTVRADRVVVSTHLPILDRGGHFGRAFPKRHMCLAAPIAADRAPDGMYIGLSSPTRSIRIAPWSSTEKLLVLIGESFPTGRADTAARLQELETFARERFAVEAPMFRWGNQDYYSADRLPYIGAIVPGRADIQIATGFSAWGITSGTAAAMIIADHIQDKENDWAPLFNARRTGFKGGASSIVGKNVAVARSWASGRLELPPAREPQGLTPGEGALVKIGGKAAAAYRDEDGTLHAFEARCTHMGCRLHWNAIERSWDCDCHGSRFDAKGAVVNGPAVTPLRPVKHEV